MAGRSMDMDGVPRGLGYAGEDPNLGCDHMKGVSHRLEEVYAGFLEDSQRLLTSVSICTVMVVSHWCGATPGCTLLTDALFKIR